MRALWLGLLCLALWAGGVSALNITVLRPPAQQRRAVAYASAGIEFVVTVDHSMSWTEVAFMADALDAERAIVRDELGVPCDLCILERVVQAPLNGNTLLVLSCTFDTQYATTAQDRITFVQAVCARTVSAAAASVGISSVIISVEADENGVYSVDALAPGIQSSAPWHLDRVDRRGAVVLDDTYAYRAQGSGVRIYVIDTGVLASHAEFITPGGGPVRAATILDSISATPMLTDCHGHGTHVSSLAAGLYAGVAKNATIRAIRALDCAGSGTTYSVVTGLLQVEEECGSAPDEPFVINLSLNGGPSNTIDTTIQRILANCHAVVVAAAGNAATNACNTSPAGVSGVLAVGALERTDYLTTFSNTGPCVRIAAPGRNVVGAGIASTSTFLTMSGTSMASPIVAGAAALAVEQLVQTWTPNASVGANAGAMIVAALIAQASSVAQTTVPVLYAAYDGSANTSYGMLPPLEPIAQPPAPLAYPAPSPGAPAPVVPSPVVPSPPLPAPAPVPSPPRYETPRAAPPPPPVPSSPPKAPPAVRSDALRGVSGDTLLLLLLLSVFCAA